MPVMNEHLCAATEYGLRTVLNYEQTIVLYCKCKCSSDYYHMYYLKSIDVVQNKFDLICKMTTSDIYENMNDKELMKWLTLKVVESRLMRQNL